MKIIQISDTHIGSYTDATLGYDVRRNFEFLLDQIIAESPDLIVHTGDLCFDLPDPKIYTWIKAKLNATGIPFEVIAGNHDDSGMISECFGRTLLNTEYYFSMQFGGHQLIFLDTATASMSQAQYEWLKSTLTHISAPVIIFMHHPPIKVGIPFIDNRYAFLGSEQFCEITDNFPSGLELFCGHYHHERQLIRKNLRIYIGPSTYFELNDLSDEFRIASSRIGYSILELSSGEPTKVSSKYFAGFSLPLYA